MDKHIYRRGHVFWWRRIHATSDSRRLDVRVSLRTFDRLEARNRGAVLTGATGGVLRMLERKLRGGEERPTEAELSAIAKAEYEYLLSKFVDQQREFPQPYEVHETANAAYADYYQRLIDTGGKPELRPGEEGGLLRQGWAPDRVERLNSLIELHSDGPAIHQRAISAHLRDLGFEPSRQLIAIVERALYPAYRDAVIGAQEQLRLMKAPKRLEPIVDAELPTSPPSSNVTPTPVPDSEPVTAPAQPITGHGRVPDEWADLTATDVAELLIADDPKLSPHRRGGKRERSTVGEQTLRQIRWAAVLIERSMDGRPFHTLRNADLRVLDEWFERLPVQCGKAPWHRDAGTTLEAICVDAEEKVENGEYDAGDIGLQVATTNKHFRKIRQTYEFMKNALKWLPELEFDKYISADIKDERAARAAYTVEQGEELFRLPPWTGCRSLKDRLDAGACIIHDSLYFVLLCVWYTGMRREEVCKLLVTDIQEFAGIWHISVRHTEAGRVKNSSSVRLIAICDELIRLGFVEYVQAIAAAGHVAVFPELVSERDGAKKGDTFYKLWWLYIKPLLPSLKRGQAMHSARHMVDTELKNLEVFAEFRDDALGHKAAGEGPSRYAKATRLQRLQALVNQIPIVTTHLVPAAIELLPAEDRRPRSRRSRDQ